MSLVGTRPPTVDEWDKYELHHRARLATKPGLTGMWQVSGRSNITDLLDDFSEKVQNFDEDMINRYKKKLVSFFGCLERVKANGKESLLLITADVFTSDMECVLCTV